MRISDWSSDVCSSDLRLLLLARNLQENLPTLSGVEARLGQRVFHHDRGHAELEQDTLDVELPLATLRVEPLQTRRVAIYCGSSFDLFVRHICFREIERMVLGDARDEADEGFGDMA